MFFTQLSQMMTSGTNINLTVHSQNGTMTVSVFPKLKGLKDEAQNHLKPIVLTGTAEELDAGFFDAVRQPVQKATGLLAGMKRFEESLAGVEAESKEKQAQKRNTDKQGQARREKYENFMSRADTQEAAGKNDNALFLLQVARKVADDDDIAKTDERINQLKAKCMQSSLF